MQNFLTTTLLFVGLVASGQKAKVRRTVEARDISDSTKGLFYAQLDSFQKYQAGIIPMDAREAYLLDSSLIGYRKNGNLYGVKPNFGMTGGIGCGYHEGDEPHKITVLRNGKEKAAETIYDFQDSTMWLSSANFKDDKINLHFKRNFPPLTHLIFYVGDQSSIANWRKYSRPKTIAVYINNKHWIDLNFKDCICKQDFEFEAIASEWKNLTISLVIKDIYSGQDKRVAISEVNFDGVIH